MSDQGTGIPVIVMGLGQIGRAIARAALAKPELRLVGAVDPSEECAGRKLGDLLGVPCPDIAVSREAGPAFDRARGGVALHATGSQFEAIYPQLEAAVKAGLSV